MASLPQRNNVNAEPSSTPVSPPNLLVETGATRMPDVPEEILVYIFSFLGLKERKNVRLVCKQWHNLSFTSSLIKRDVLRVDDSFFSLQPLITGSQYPTVKVRFSCRGKADVLAQLVSNLGAYIKTLYVGCTPCRAEMCPYIFAKCPNLEHLVFSSTECSCLVNGGFDGEYNVGGPWSGMLREYEKNFKANIGRYCTDIFKKLMSVIVNGLSDVLTPIIELVTVSTCGLQSISVSDWEGIDVESIEQSVKALILRHSATLREISLGGNQVNELFLNEISSIQCHQLKRFCIRNCEGYQDLETTLGNTSKSFINLEEIIINCDLLEYTDMDFSSIANLVHLSVVSFANLSITDNDVDLFDALTNLSHLDLSGCLELSNDGVARIFQEYRPKIIDLRLNGIYDITDALFEGILPNLPNLEVLAIDECSELTNLSLTSIFLYSKLLRCLSFKGCPNITDLSVGLSVNSLKRLAHLTVECWESEKPGFLVSLPNLQTFSASKAISFDKTLSLVNGCPTLYSVKGGTDLEKVQTDFHSRKKSSVSPCDNSSFGSCTSYK